MNTQGHPRTTDRSAEEQADRPQWTARQAARYCGVGKSTILRALKTGKLPNAKREDDAWSIPVADLIAAGFHPDHVGNSAPGQADHPRTTDRSTLNHPGPPSSEELIDLRNQLQQEQNRRELAEQARDHARDQVRLLTENISDLRTTIRMLEPANSSQTALTGSAPELEEAQPRPQRRWWRRSNA